MACRPWLIPVVLTFAALVMGLTACNGDETAEQEGLPVPQNTDEVRAEQTINDYIGALRDKDYEEACDLLAVEGIRQVFSVGAPPQIKERIAAASPQQLRGLCPSVMRVAYRTVDVPDVHVEPTEARSEGGVIVVESDAGTFRLMDNTYEILEIPTPQ